MYKPLFFISILLFCYWFLVYGFGFFEINWFDDALRILSVEYASLGLKPYQDFGVVYPPGYILLFTHVMPGLSVLGRYLVLSVLVTSFMVVIMFLIRFRDRSPLINVRNACLAILGVLWLRNVPSDPISLPLMALNLTVIDAYLRQTVRKSWLLIGIGGMTWISVFFRWDWPLFLCFLSSAMLMALYLFSLSSKVVWKRMLEITCTVWFAYILAVAGLAAFLWGQGTLVNAFEFVVTIPAKVILEYRRLPLPWFESPRALNSLLTGSLLAIAIWFVKNLKSQTPIQAVILSVLPFSLLPYALGRSGWPHFLPFSTMVSFVLLLTSVRFKRQLGIGLATGLLLLTYRLLLPADLSQGWNHTIFDMEKQLSYCKQLGDSVSARSIFVGRESYRRFIVNVASIYTVFPKTRPATPFISDEPGLQNSCLYGNRIAENLESAEKPMLVYLELGDQAVEKNKTASMESCGLIEAYLQNAEHDRIGFCEAYSRTFEVRIYK